MKKTVLIVLAGLSLGSQAFPQAPQFSADGQLLLPKNYREWVYLSSGLGMTYGPAAQADGGNPMFDNVFIERAAYRAFVESGKWPDKTMFILEIRRERLYQQRGPLPNRGRFRGVRGEG